MKSFARETIVNKLILKIGRNLFDEDLCENIFVDFLQLIDVLKQEAESIDDKEILNTLIRVSQKIQENRKSQEKSTYARCYDFFPILLEEYIKIIDRK